MSDTSDREIFVGNVVASVRRREIEKLFKQYGPVDKVWSRSVVGFNEKKTRTIARKFKKTGNNALDVVNFYVRFKSPEDATKAIELNGNLFKGSHLRVTSVNKKALSIGFSVFVSNLPFDITEEAIYNHFEECGVVKAVRVIHDKFSGLCKGAAFVEFSDKSCIEKAITKNGSTLSDREIRVSKALKRKQLMKEEAEKSTKVKNKKSEKEKIKTKIADYVVQKKKPSDKATAQKPTFKPRVKGKKLKKGAKATIKSIMT